MPITSLPVEVISNICCNLQLSDWQALRLSCHKLYKNSFKEFSSQYFKSVRFLVTSDSLCELEALAQTDGIREQVQELWMIPSMFEGYQGRCPQCEKAMYGLAVSSKSCQPVEGDELKARYAIYRAMVTDSSSLLESEAFSTRLRRCLDQFKNLDTIGLARYPTTLLLDLRQQKGRCLGWHRLIDQIDFRFESRSLSELHRFVNNTLALSRLFQALSAATRKIKKLSTCNADYCGGVRPENGLTEGQHSSLLSTLNEVEDLHICLAFNNNSRPIDDRLSPPNWADLLLDLAPRLEKLTLSQDLYSGEFFQKIAFTCLKELHLHKTHILCDDLKTLLHNTKANLTVLTLFEIILDDDLHDPQKIHSSFSPFYSPPTPVFIPYQATFSPASPSHTPHTLAFSLTSTSGTPNTPAYCPALTLYTPSSPVYCLTHQPPPGRRNNPLARYTPFAKHENLLWRDLWNFIRDELSLQKFTMERLAHKFDQIFIEGINGLIEPSESADFDAQLTGVSFVQWLDQLRPMVTPATYDTSDWKLGNEKAWFNKMIPETGAIMCDRKVLPQSWCHFGCSR